MPTKLVLLATLGLLLQLSACTNAQTCDYPCILNNGCQCNHTVVHQGADGQNYGTCDQCNPGWTGFDCSSNVSPCVNGGILQPDGSCDCTYSWTGAHCGSQDCVNSVGGTGPDSIVPVNFTNNVCDRCKPGFTGIACEMCTLDSQCDGPGDSCFTDLLYHAGERKVIECDILPGLWLDILGHGRDIKGKAKMQCDNYLAGCYISIWRVEPDNAYFDPFLYCAMSDCTSTTVQGVTNTTITPMPDFATPVRYLLQALMLASLIVLQLGSLWHMKSSRRSTLFAILGITVIGLIIAQVSFSSVYAHDDVDTTVVNETMASYVCKNTNCTCAKDPPVFGYTPHCLGSFAGDFVVPFLKGTSSVLCNTATGACEFDQAGLGGAPIELQCIASECSNQTVAIPNFDIGGQQSTVIYSLAGAAGVIGLIVGSYIFSKAHGKMLAAEFHRNYDSVESRRNSRAPGTPLNDAVDGLATSPFLVHHQRTVSYNSAIKVTPPTEQLHVQVQSLKYFVKGREDPVLKGATFDFKSGEMVAIIGPSGAGKTTLLDILAHREKIGRVEGAITLNGVAIQDDNVSSYRRLIGFVAQEDVLVPTLTVWESIYFAAKLKLPSTFPDRLVRSIVDSTIDVLQLSACAGTLVGGSNRRGISGGEKRRVSIATELVANPRILFLDEPTSGLDSVSAVEVMRAIVNLTKRSPENNYASFFDFQPAVVFSIHQPSSEICDMFDRILLVSRGYVLYSGTASDAVQRVETILSLTTKGVNGRQEETQSTTSQRYHSAAEQLLRLQHECSDVEFQTWKDASSRSDEHLRPLHAIMGECVMARTAASLKYYPRPWEQVILLGRRTWASLLGASYLIHSHAAATAFLAIALSLLYNQVALTLQGTEDKAGMMTFLLLILGFSSLSALDLFISEKKLFCAERENGYYSTGSYFIVKVLFDFVPLRIVPTLMLSSTIYYPMGLRIDGSAHFLWFLFITTIFSLFVTGICFCVAILTPSFGTAALVSALIILWHTVYGGLMLQAASIPVYLSYFKYLSPFYYAYEALMVNELEGQQCTFNPADSEGSYTGAVVPVSCQQFLFNLGLDPRHFNFDMIMLCVCTAANLIIGFLLLALVRVKH